MACYRPLRARRDADGRIVFQQGLGEDALMLPCGQCIGCRMDRSRQWALRCVHEAQMHRANSFLTLTYSDECLPGDWSLSRGRGSDLELFFKRLRKAGLPFRYYACGEYGKLLRPHYHVCLFGYDFTPDRVLFKRNKRGEGLYVSDYLQRKWQKGHCLIGDLTYESAAYVARYVMKKLSGPQLRNGYVRYDSSIGTMWQVEPEFSVMSKGIGSEWFEKYGSEVFPADEVVYNGRRHKTPRYYDNKLSESDLEEFKEKRRAKAKRYEYEQTHGRLKVREFCEEDKLKRYERSL